MKYLWPLMIFSLFGCEEFYDEEFQEAEDARIQENEEITYGADLAPINRGTFPELTGKGLVAIRDGSVKVDVDAAGVPENFIKLNYGIIAASCSVLQPPVITPAGTSTRTYTISESMTTGAFSQDLRSSGAVTAAGDTNLQGKSLILRATPHFSGTPNPTGTNESVVACGELQPQEAARNDDVFNPNPIPAPNPNPGPIPPVGFPPGPDRGDVGNPFPDRGDVGNPFPDRGDVGTDNLPPF